MCSDQRRHLAPRSLGRARRAFMLMLALWFTVAACAPAPLDRPEPTTYVTIERAVFLDKLQGGWVGQMIGVQWGAPTEFRYQGVPISSEVRWFPRSINRAFHNDDLYVEIPFLEAMKEHGVAVGWEEYGAYFGDTLFELWHANDAGRSNLQSGIRAPDSGHYAHNPHADDIDWQIEADFAGLLAPGQPGAAIDIAWRAGHVMNYGDGVYGGVAVAAMHAAAYFATSVDEIVEAGRQAVPQGSQYRHVIEDIITWHDQYPGDWQRTWQLLETKWAQGDRCPEGAGAPFNIDAKINGAYVFMGLLYGEGDFAKSMEIAMRCGQDSDCNPSTVGGILGTWVGLSGIPEEFKAELDPSYPRFAYTLYSYNQIIELSTELAREVLVMNGGRIEGQGDGEVWSVPVQQTIVPPLLEQWPTTPNDAPVLTATVEKVNGRTVTFRATATDGDGIGAYQWYFGDLSYANGAEVAHTYRQDGTYTAIAYVSDATGNTAWRALPIEVGQATGTP